MMGKIALNIIKKTERSNSEPPEYLICFSAKTQKALYKYIEIFSAWLSGEDGEKSNIGDIAYTLLAGRSRFNYRFAFRAKDKNELKLKLADVIRNGGFGECEVGNANHYNKNAGSADYSESLEKRFVSGGAYDWDGLYDNLGLRRISLPAYAFSNEKFWARTLPHDVNADNKSLSAIIDANCSTIDEIRFCKTFNGNEFYIKDHVAGSDKILPGAAYLEIAVSAGEFAKPGAAIFKIENVIWADPLIMPKGGHNIQTFIGLYPKPQGADFEVYSETNAEKRVIYSQGRICYADRQNKKRKKEFIDLHAIQQRCSDRISGTDCYENYKTRGLNLGENFHTIKYLCCGENEAISYLVLPEKLSDSFSDYQLNPVMVDGALETVIGLVEKMKIGSLSLPCGIDSVEIYGRLEKNCFSYVLPSQNTRKGVNKFDVVLANDKGEIILKIFGFSLKSMETPQNKKWAKYLSPTWEPLMSKENPSPACLFGKTLVFSMNETILDHIIFKFGNTGDKKPDLIFVKTGEEFKKLKENVFTVKSADDYKLLFNLLAREGWIPENIIHACSFENKDGNDINAQLRPLHSLFHIIKGMSAANQMSNINLLYIYENGGETANPYYAAMSAFLKTAALEFSGLKCRTLGVGSLDDGKALAINISDILNDEETAGKDLRLLQNRLYVQRLTAISNSEISDSGSLLRQRGVYLITGGCGGIGRIVAAYLAGNYHARLVLIGKSELDSVKKSFLQSIKSAGGDAIYINCDVSKEKDLLSALNKSKEKFSEINGVIHCAGTTNDALLLKKTETEIQKVLMPKVNGTINLDKATANEKLDFFIMFSSIAALLGNVGQSDYAYANSFMDNFANVRSHMTAKGLRAGKTVSINWTLWENGGMHVKDETKRLFENTFGVDCLSDETGLAVFLKSLSIEKENILFVSGDKLKIEKMLSINTKNRNISTKIVKPQKNVLLPKIQKSVGYLVSEILKVKQSDIIPEKDMNEYGFNSMTFTKLTNRINEKYHTDITPAILFEHSTLGSFADYLYDEYGQQFAESEDNSEIEIESISENDEMPQKTADIKAVRSLKPKSTAASADRGIDNNSQCQIDRDIAIIGMFGIMPCSDSLADFWNNLLIGKDMVTEIPKDRWDFEKYSSADGTISRWGSFMKEVDKFDAKFFGISPREAELMDPQQRILLEVVWKTIEDAGYNPYDFSGSKTGLFVGHSTMDYSQLLMDQGTEIEAYSSTGSARCMLVNRISYFLNLHGPSEPVDTACSSSLIAVHRAAQSILNGECGMAIAGGINVMLNPTLHISFSKAGMLSPDGRCKTFDKSANGYVRGEGAGTVLLKPLKQAQADGDYIYAVIKGSAVNHGGKVNSLTAPNPNAQAEVIISAMEKAAVDPSTITYIEAHGTGTKIGDPVEINGLKKAYGELFRRNNKQFPSKPYCGIGTVKTSIGHLEAAAGIASIIKTLLCMKYGIFPRNINLKEANPYIDIKGTPFYLIDGQREWVRLTDAGGREIPRRAGISGFGFGGANAHIVLEEYRNISENDKEDRHIITLSANSEQGVNLYAKDLLRFITDLNLASGEAECKTADAKAAAYLLKKFLKNSLGAALDVSQEEISADDHFREIGLDDVAGAKFIDSVNETFKLSMPVTVLGEISTLNELADYILSKHFEAVSGMLGGKSITAARETAGYAPSIADIAYTLNVGRAAMPCRIAIIADNIGDLEQKLKEFCDGKPDVQDVYYGRENIEKSSGARLLLEGIEGRQFIYHVIKNRNLQKLCEMWTAGVQIDWKQVWNGDGTRRRVPLPTYSFEHKRYWFKDNAPTSKQEETADKTAAIPDKKAFSRNAEPDSAGGLDYSVGDNYSGDEVELKIIDGRIAVVIMKDEEHINTFSNNLVFGLINIFGKLRKNDRIKAIIVTGYGHVFCMGGTQEQLTAISEKKNKFSDMPFMYRGLLEAKVPVIAAMQGHASGGGMLFGLYADVVIMAEESVYSATFTKYGFTPGMGATLILGEKLGENLATEMMFTAKGYTGEELRRRGATVIFKKRDEVLTEAVSIARMLAEKPLGTLTVLKKELSGRILRKLPEIIRVETQMHDRTFSDPETQKRIEKFYSPAGENAENKRGIAKKAAKTLLNQQLDINNERPAISLKPREQYSEIQDDSVLERPQEAISLRDISACGSVGSEDHSVAGGAKAAAAEEERLDKPAILHDTAGQRPPENGAVPGAETVQAGINIILSRILHIPAVEIDGYASFSDMGIDSVNGVEIVRDINKKYGLNIETVALYDHSTTTDLAAFVAEEIKKRRNAASIAGASNMHLATEFEGGGDAVVSSDSIHEKAADTFCEENQNVKGDAVNNSVSHTGDVSKNAPAELEEQSISQGNIKKEEVQSEINGILSRILHISPEEIDDYSSFKDMGVDSVNGVEIMRDINKKYNLNLETVVLYDHSTTSGLAAFVMGEIKNFRNAADIAGTSNIHLATELADVKEDKKQTAAYCNDAEPQCKKNDEDDLVGLLEKLQNGAADIQSVAARVEDY